MKSDSLRTKISKLIENDPGLIYGIMDSKLDTRAQSFPDGSPLKNKIVRCVRGTLCRILRYIHLKKIISKIIL
jgi:hypothetical protein